LRFFRLIIEERKVNKIIIFVLALSGAVFFNSSLLKANVCTELDIIEDLVFSTNYDDNAGTVFALLNKFLSQRREPYFERKNIPYEYGFTNSSGNAFIPSCNQSGMQISLYYPIGTTVKILGEKRFPFRGKYEQFYYVVSGYGLRYFLQKKKVSPLKHGMAYYFQNGIGEYRYCLSEDMSCKRTQGEKGEPGLHPDYTFASRKTTNMHRKRIAQYYAFQNSGPEEPGLCKPFRVTHFTQGHKIGYDSAYLSLCTPSGHLGTVKVVTIDSAKQLFADNVQGSFYRESSGFSEGLLEKLATKVGVPFLVKHTCDIEEMDSVAMNGKIGVKAETPPLGFLGLSGSLSGEYQKEFKRVSGKDKYFLMSQYTISTIPTVGSVDTVCSVKPRTYGIILTSKCKGNDHPAEAGSIELFHDMLDNGHAVMLANSDSWEKDKYDSSLKEVYMERIGSYSGYAPVKNPDLLEMGQFWSVRDSLQYFFWRDVLRQHLENSQRWRSFLNNIDQSKHEHLKRFFVHLFLSAAFSFSS